jgi:hypothetical protein
VLIVALSLGLEKTSEIGSSLGEQHHNVADPFVIVAAAIVLGSVWKLTTRQRGGRLLGRVACIAALAAAVYHSAGQWPSGPSGSNWDTAHAVAIRIERDAAGQSLAIVGLPHGRPTDIYGFPLVFDGVTPVAYDQAVVLVLLCDPLYSSTCGWSLEDGWIATHPNASGFKLVDRFLEATDKTVSVYTR